MDSDVPNCPPENAEVKNILVIEDNAVQAYLVKKMLSRFDAVRFNVEVVERLATGMQRLKERTFDAVLLDLGLPDSQGVETVKCLREEAPDVPVLVLTNLDSRENAPQALQLGAQDYLVKRWVNDHLLGRALMRQIEKRGTV